MSLKSLRVPCYAKLWRWLYLAFMYPLLLPIFIYGTIKCLDMVACLTFPSPSLPHPRCWPERVHNSSSVTCKLTIPSFIVSECLYLHMFDNVFASGFKFRSWILTFTNIYLTFLAAAGSWTQPYRACAIHIYGYRVCDSRGTNWHITLGIPMYCRTGSVLQGVAREDAAPAPAGTGHGLQQVVCTLRHTGDVSFYPRWTLRLRDTVTGRFRRPSILINGRGDAKARGRYSDDCTGETLWLMNYLIKPSTSTLRIPSYCAGVSLARLRGISVIGTYRWTTNDNI